MKCSLPDRQAKNKKLVIRKGAYFEKVKRRKPFKCKRSLLQPRERSDQGAQIEKGHACCEKVKRQRRRKSKRSPLWERERSDRGKTKEKGHACPEKVKRQRRRKRKRSPLVERERSDRGKTKEKGHHYEGGRKRPEESANKRSRRENSFQPIEKKSTKDTHKSIMQMPPDYSWNRFNHWLLGFIAHMGYNDIAAGNNEYGI